MGQLADEGFALVARHRSNRAKPATADGRVLRRLRRRWVVERTLGWLNKCRGLLVRYDKNWQNDLGLLQFACGLLWFRRLHTLQNAGSRF